MSDELKLDLRSVSEDVLRGKVIADLGEGKTLVTLHSSGIQSLARDYLANHPADDNEPLTPEWLVENGGGRIYDAKMASVNHVADGFSGLVMLVGNKLDGRHWMPFTGNLMPRTNARNSPRVLMVAINMPSPS